MSTQTDTPETDAAQRKCLAAFCVDVDFARKLERERDEARTQIQMMIEHDNRRLESDSIVASCDCLTKTNEVQYHKPGCKYRLICERDDARAALSGRTVSCSQCNETANELEAARVKLEFLASKGITVGILKSSDCPQGQLAYVIKPDSELCDLKHVHRVIDAESKLEAMREAIEIVFRRVDFAIINHNLDGETSLEHIKQARTQLLPFVMP